MLSLSMDWLAANKIVSYVHQPEFPNNVMVWIHVLVIEFLAAFITENIAILSPLLF